MGLGDLELTLVDTRHTPAPPFQPLTTVGMSPRLVMKQTQPLASLGFLSSAGDKRVISNPSAICNSDGVRWMVNEGVAAV